MHPTAVPILSDGMLYGTTSGGLFIPLSPGTVFKVRTDGTGYEVLKHFGGGDGANPWAGLKLSGNTLYGSTRFGGTRDEGTIFKLNTDGTEFLVLKHCTLSEGGYPYAGVTLTDGVLYGTMWSGGGPDWHDGAVFKMNTDGTGYTVLKHFTGIDGEAPYAGVTLSGNTLYGTTVAGGPGFFRSYYSVYPGSGSVFKLNVDGTGFEVLKHFSYSDGAQPRGRLVSSGNTLYGTTVQGGTAGYGTVFKLNADGMDYKVLNHFTYTGHGAWPNAGLTLSGNILYGTTFEGGEAEFGTMFKLNTDGTAYTVLTSFTAPDGYGHSELTLSAGTLYGATALVSVSNHGAVFKLDVNGRGFRAIKHFTGYDGSRPSAGLALLGNNTLYGTTYEGGVGNKGIVFRLNTNGTGYEVLKHFDGSDGAHPSGRLTLGGSTIYGTTAEGGSWNKGTVFNMNIDGTGYQVMKHFEVIDGSRPLCELVLYRETLYGTTSEGGSAGYGTVFKLNTDGTGYRVLKDFKGTDGRGPAAGLTLSGSTLYGTTEQGGSLGSGTVFKLELSGIHLVAAPDGAIILNWLDSAFALQAAPDVAGPYTSVIGATSPYTNTITGNRRFFRLIEN